MADDKKLSIYKRYWVYSPTEAKRIKAAAANTSNYTLGTVVTDGGISKNYTSIVNDISKIKQSDSVIVMTGDIRKVHYTNPSIG